MKIHSYPKVYALGHPAIEHLMDGTVYVQEKYDGSQFSWAWDEDGRLHARSKGTTQYGGSDNRTEPDGIFEKAVGYVRSLEPVNPGVIYRAEAFAKPKHNTLAYDRAPENGLVLFDVEVDPNKYLTPYQLADVAAGFGIEAARFIVDAPGDDISIDALKLWLEDESTLGGPKVEGVVIKNYDRFGRDGKILAGKYVSEAFKEKHKREWKGANPSQGDIVQNLIDSLNTEARWRKAVQHLRDDGALEGSPRDIGPLMKEVKRDTVAEEKEWIAGKLLEWAMPKISRALGSGLPEWYKAELAESQFAEADRG